MAASVVLVFVGVVATGGASTTLRCSYPCTKSVAYTSTCGLFKLWNCRRHRTEPDVCYRTGVNGGWSSWSTLREGECSATCGGGIRVRTSTRSCSNPYPTYCGVTCPGSATRNEQVACNTHCCPGDEHWSSWAAVGNSSCSVTCGGGLQKVTYTRECNVLASTCGPRNCTGNVTMIQQRACNTHTCPTGGQWGRWGAWRAVDECSALCGGGEIRRRRERQCDNPPPEEGGEDCHGNHTEIMAVPCNVHRCPGRCQTGDFIAHTNNNQRYYRCDNGVARLAVCDNGTTWDQRSHTCRDKQQQRTTPLVDGGLCDDSVLYLPHQDCTKFILCVHGTAAEISCPEGTRYNDAINACDVQDNVQC
ncbi:coadhesin-like [Pomacea canaliculata]|uniref:coadhesin-like n=1 Tax=Pomacea canaliculata TaxID=400727 RepID=UPI000D73AF23|nr:coadhesin-like [Pomacea canaliculata]